MLKRIYKPLTIGVFALLLVACSTSQSVRNANIPPAAEAPFYAGDFIADQQLDNPLIGHFWSPATEQFYSWEQVLTMLPEGGWVMLGEQHDHPDHHVFQAEFLQALADERVLGNVAMEMLAVDQQRALDSSMMRRDLLPYELNWNPGWPWEHYQAQVHIALMWANRVLAGDLAEEQKDATRRDIVEIPHYSPAHSEFLLDLVVTSHCNLFPADMAAPMLKMQLARDQFMARQMNRNVLADKVSVFIAGGGHVRADYGAPLWLNAEVPRLTIMLQAVGSEHDASTYLQDRVEGRLPADLIYFVPAVEERDYCAEFLETMRGGS